MITRPNKNLLSPEGQKRKSEMLGQIQDSMIDFGQKKRQRLRRLQGIGVAGLIVLFGMGVWYQNSGVRRPERSEIAESNPAKSVESDKDVNKNKRENSQPIPTGSLNHPESNRPKKSTMVEKYVVKTAEVKTRKVESIDDDEMLELLKRAGVEAWIAEIDDQRVVLNDDGKIL